MARARKRHLQQDLFRRVVPGKHGGWRPGAGRKRHGRGSAPHRTRPEVDAGRPVHVVLRVTPAVRGLRKRKTYAALREATLAVARRELHEKENGAFRIVHISIQRTHVHLLVEADHKMVLSRGMQSFQISAARHINGALGRKGKVFPDRFHEEVIDSPRRARNALAYVVNNWRKHREDRGADERTWNVDPFSTGVLFDGWKEREDEVLMWRWRDTYDPLVVYRPRSWLLREGWRKGGPPVGFREVPGRD